MNPLRYFLTPDQEQAAQFIDGRRFAVPLSSLGREPGADGSLFGSGTFLLRKIHQGTFAVMRIVCPFTQAEQEIAEGWGRGWTQGVFSAAIKNEIEYNLPPAAIMHLMESVQRQDKEMEKTKVAEPAQPA